MNKNDFLKLRPPEQALFLNQKMIMGDSLENVLALMELKYEDINDIFKQFRYDQKYNSLVTSNLYYINKNLFELELVPFFEETKEKLIKLISNPRILNKFKRIQLGLVNNDTISEKEKIITYLFYGDNNNFYFNNGHIKAEADEYTSSTTTSRYTEIWWQFDIILSKLRTLFVMEILKISKTNHIVDYIVDIISSYYRDFDCFDNDEYVHLRFNNLQFENSIFTITASRTNIIIPKVSALNGDLIIDQTANSKKLLITQMKNIDEFKNFNNVISFIDFCSYLSAVNFSSSETIKLIKNVTKMPYSNLYEIVELLNSTESEYLFKMKHELVNMEYSDGKSFEYFLMNFLTVCFGSAYKNLNIDSQVPNEGNRRIRDFIIENIDSNNVFLTKLENQGVEFILLDAKNYKDELTNSELDTFRRYIEENKRFGNFGIILSRKGTNENCLKTIVDDLRRSDLKIIVLNEDDLINMLSSISSGRDPIDIIRFKYNELVLKA